MPSNIPGGAPSSSHYTDGIDFYLAEHLNDRIDDIYALATNFGFMEATELTISGGAVTRAADTGNYFTIDTEGDAASDELDTINGGDEALICVFRPENDARTVVVRNGTGNILCIGGIDLVLDDEEKYIIAIYDAGLAKWIALKGCEKDILTANRTYYVRTDGDDGNTGLVDSAAGAFLTIQHAVDIVAMLDINGYAVTIDVGDGAYAEAVNLKNVVGFAAAGDLIIQGNAGTPTNVSTTSITANGLSAAWTINDMRLTSQLFASKGSVLYFSGLDFSGGVQQIRADDAGMIICEGNYTISGSATNHMTTVSNGIIRIQSKTVTISGTLTFTQFVNASFLSSMIVNGNTYTIVDSVTGTRYSSTLNSLIYTGGGGAAYFPGDAAGSTATGGLYT